jgi:hypothetical protein
MITIMDGVRAGIGMFIVLPLMIAGAAVGVWLVVLLLQHYYG